jgi:hypothetical protein
MKYHQIDATALFMPYDAVVNNEQACGDCHFWVKPLFLLSNMAYFDRATMVSKTL